jgi:hypothetical protein
MRATVFVPFSSRRSRGHTVFFSSDFAMRPINTREPFVAVFLYAIILFIVRTLCNP